jgi:hypothetical protein
VEIRRTLHLDEFSQLRFVSREQVYRCIEDPDRVHSTRLRGSPERGLLFSRDFLEGTLSVVVRAEDDRFVLVTTYWRRPLKRRTVRRRR